MERELREIAGDDQFDAERRDGRRLATAIAEDVVTYYTVLTDGGLDKKLVATLTEQFAQHWLEPPTQHAQIVVSTAWEDDDV